ncbi:MAG: hypothetical protein A2275_13190 [Bacteroidetes bacterium RIFOXYA12_FULL_35_11]|nr:MAG: hypothetical protein A2X01_11575 [Bacteroidetes bacterium GWF2_35_48]OFY72674.1 MAG: hypothetical protein A2275_13190 [Bacteroidetes bacterium RIFOXYA12_FULL_35_11]OFY97400.1 MAG: hypothetical protein A2309_03455 [Bacteroidetes bacterium RIFOXYB2_FULL_35_7]HBX50985.1 hypothetical protein [Bacteroidales bacterium]
MESDWQVVYSTDKEYIAEMIKALLEDNEMDAFIMNKKDSFYVTIGDIEIYVKRDDLLKAKLLINNSGFE